SGSRRTRTRASSTWRRGSVPKPGALATTNPRKWTAGSGKYPSETRSKRTGRSSRRLASARSNPWIRGRSRRYGRLARRIAPSTSRPAPRPTRIRTRRRARITPPSRRRGPPPWPSPLGSGHGLLDGGDAPGVRTHRSREGPVLVERARHRVAPLDDRAGRLVDGVVEDARLEAHGQEVLPVLLPGLGDLGAVHR